MTSCTSFASRYRPAPSTIKLCLSQSTSAFHNRPSPFLPTYRPHHKLTSPSSVRRKIMSSSLSKELRGKHDARRECLGASLSSSRSSIALLRAGKVTQVHRKKWVILGSLVYITAARPSSLPPVSRRFYPPLAIAYRLQSPLVKS